MKRTALLSSEEKIKPILIVDKRGILGKELAIELSKEILVVFVTREKNTEGLNLQNTIHIPYRKKFPSIPNNIYSHIILFNQNDPNIEDLLSVFSKKSFQDKSSLSYITSLTEKSLRFTKKINNLHGEIKTIIYGDIFGNGKALEFDNLVNSILKQVIKDKKIKIPGDGLTRVYPVLVGDVVKGIFKAIFGGESSRLFYLFPKHPESLISFSHAIQKIDPSVAVDFIKDKKVDREFNIDGKGEFLLKDDEKILEKLKKIDFNETIDQSSRTFNEDNKLPFIIKKLNILYGLLFIIFLLILPSFFAIFTVGLGFYKANSAISNIEKGDIPKFSEKLNQGKFLLDLGRGAGAIVEFQLSAIGMGEKVAGALAIIDDYAKLLESGIEISNSASSIGKVFEGKTVFPVQTVLASMASYNKSLSDFEEIRINKQISNELIKKAEKYDSVFKIAYGINNSIYSVINPAGARKYLILFQNNMELRPGGGFIGSYGVLDIDRGKITDFSIHDVYEADGQLKGHIEPPYPVRRYLPSAHLYLRDSNFDIEFTGSASSAALLFFIETGLKVDGVIGVDVSFVKELIGALGEINVPDYDQKVNEDNFYYITQSHVEKDFFPSSTQKKDFLSSLYKALNNKLLEDSPSSYDKIALAISKAIIEKHVVFAFSDKNTQAIFTANNWSSDINDNRKTKNSIVNDFIGINEANLGVNKANYFVTRSVKYEAQINTDGRVTSKASLNLKNDSDKWPGGDYKVYLRIITPQNSVITSIEIDGKTQRQAQAVTNPLLYEARTFRPPSGLEVERYDQSGKAVYGFLTTVAAGKSKEISVSYTHFRKVIPTSPQLNYSLEIFKQPGTGGYPFNFSLTYPKDLSPQEQFSDAILEDGRIVFTKTLTSDENIILNLSKK